MSSHKGKYLLKCDTPEELFAVKTELMTVVQNRYRVPFHSYDLNMIKESAWGKRYRNVDCPRCLRIDFDKEEMGWDIWINYKPGGGCCKLISGYEIMEASEFMNDVFGVDIGGCVGIDIDVESYI